MADNPADPIINKQRMRNIADESAVGHDYEGESLRERAVGHSREVVVDIFKRRIGPNAGTYFLRVSLRSCINPKLISRYEIDMDQYSTEKAFLDMVAIGGGAVAEADNEKRGANWDCEYVAKQAREAAKELLHDINAQAGSHQDSGFSLGHHDGQSDSEKGREKQEGAFCAFYF